MKRASTARALIAGLAVVTALGLTACSDDKSDTSSSTTASSSSTATTGDASLPAIPTVDDLQKRLATALDPSTPAATIVNMVQGADTDPTVVEKLATTARSSGATIKVTSVIPPTQPYGPDGAVLNASADLTIPGANTNTVRVPFVPEKGEWKLQKTWMCMMVKNLDPNNVPKSCNA